MTTIADLRRVSAKSLSEKILAEREAKETTFAIVDVRDDGKSARHPCGSLFIHPLFTMPRSNFDKTTSAATSKGAPTCPPTRWTP